MVDTVGTTYFCSVPDCDRPRNCRGYCKMHYTRFMRHGNVERDYNGKSFEERFWDKVEVTGFCWNWTGSLVNGKYGNIAHRGKTLKAHRVAYELLVGKIPAGFHIDHLCRNTKCVNPDHLEPVTQAENNKRSPNWAGNRKSCPHGHAYTEENTVVLYSSRYCRKCGYK